MPHCGRPLPPLQFVFHHPTFSSSRGPHCHLLYWKLRSFISVLFHFESAAKVQHQGVAIMEVPFVPENSRGFVMPDVEGEELESVSSFYSDDDDDDDDGSVNSSSSSSSLCLPSSSSSDEPLEEGPLFEMSSLISLLPIKRGLSKHFDGKSQSFTSLANVRSLEDLAKPERPLAKRKLNSCKSYGGGLDRHKALSPRARTITKKVSSSSSLPNARRRSFLSQRPPVCSQRSSNISSFCMFD
ncbi:hypothetical protein Cni_G18535 [Canna indica]|uniref:Uncharacterized protein n=1 Tax=Canna indica TaxID=4628 RepID=A0AAQ3KPH7_9LILI|nr:hypothetical protein Cni_G18535 [Canna indica]